jgi:purine-nucleoside phosphorylase
VVKDGLARKSGCFGAGCQPAIKSQDSGRLATCPTNMHELSQQIAQAVEAVRSHWPGQARVGIILGTGLGSVAAQIQTEVQIEYAALPHFPQSTTIGHAGKLVCGRLQGISVVAMEGRFHAYEGYSYRQIAFPVRVMRALGANLLIVSNACGGLNPRFTLGDIMVIEDHINLMNGNPLIGPNDESLGPRFPDMCCPYDPVLIKRALEIARAEKFTVHRGVYAAVVGPNLETRAEYRALRILGADAVGMSTVPEVLVALHSGMRVLGLSVVTDLCMPETLKPAVIEEIIAVAAAAEPKLRALVLGILAGEAEN